MFFSGGSLLPGHTVYTIPSRFRNNVEDSLAEVEVEGRKIGGNVFKCVRGLHGNLFVDNQEKIYIRFARVMIQLQREKSGSFNLSNK